MTKKKTCSLVDLDISGENFPEENPNPILRISMDGKIVYANAATLSCLRTLNCAAGQLAPEELNSLAQRSMRNGVKAETEMNCGGSYYDFISVPAKSGDFVNVYGHNITKRKQIEKELQKIQLELEKRVEERIQELSEQAAILDNAYEAIIVRDLEGRILYWNKGAERLYGYTAQEVCSKKVKEFLFKNPTQYDEAFRDVCAKGEWNGELEHVTKDGSIRTVDAHWSLVSDKNMKPKSVIAVITDITDRKKLEAQYLRAQRLESIGTLAGGIAHDMRNILTPIMITLNLLDKNLTKKEDREMITLLQKNLQRGADLTTQLLSFARGTEGERIKVHVPTLIFEIEKTIKETFPRSIAVETQIGTDDLTIIGDSTQLHQVLINLCINARDAMPHGGILSIKAERIFVDEHYAKMQLEAKMGSYVLIEVSDNGMGMTKEVKDRLFEPFFTTKKLGEGTGLGLTTTRSIVKSHGGFINVYSELGRGTSFKIFLPITDTKDKEEKEVQTDQLPQGSGQTILVVDDEELIRITTSVALQNNGYNTLEAADGAEAVAIYALHREKVQAVLLDMAMPIMDGEATLRALKKLNPEVKVIGMSGLAENGKYRPVHSLASAFLTKPFTADKLLYVVGKVTSGKQD